MSNSEKHFDDLPELPDLWAEDANERSYYLSKQPAGEAMATIALASLGLVDPLEMEMHRNRQRMAYLSRKNGRRENGPPPPYVSNKRPSKRRLRRTKGRANPQ